VAAPGNVLRFPADTNIFISGFNFARIPQQILNLSEAGAIHLSISGDILEEVVLKSLPKIQLTIESSNAQLPLDPNTLLRATGTF
jgi:hypothetical protein